MSRTILALALPPLLMLPAQAAPPEPTAIQHTALAPKGPLEAPTCAPAEGPAVRSPDGTGLAMADGHVLRDGRWTRPMEGPVEAWLWDAKGLLAVAHGALYAIDNQGAVRRLGSLGTSKAEHRFHGEPLLARRKNRYAVIRDDGVYLGQGNGAPTRVAFDTNAYDTGAFQGYHTAVVDLWTHKARLALGWSWSAGCGGGGEGHDFLAAGKKLSRLPPIWRPASAAEIARGNPKRSAVFTDALDVAGGSAGWFYLRPFPYDADGEGQSEAGNVYAIRPDGQPRRVLSVDAKASGAAPVAVIAPDQESAVLAFGGALWRLRGAQPAVRIGTFGDSEVLLSDNGHHSLVLTETHLESRTADAPAEVLLPICTPSAP